MEDTTVILIIVAAVAVTIMVIGIVVGRARERKRSAELRARFGPEYDRTVEELGRVHAERELIARTRRVKHFRFSELGDAERARFQASWHRIQSQFVDDPAVAVAGANQLISEVMRARGYPTEDFQQRVADLSVEHPTVVQHYRAAHALSASTNSATLVTEELRQAMVHFRVLFGELLAEAPQAAGRLAHSHA